MEFFSMGGYAAYVWPAFIIAAAVLLGVAAVSVRSLRRAQAALRELQAGQGTDEA